MALISSAQNQEDIMLWRALKTVERGFYIDVGAADPVEMSVTKLFYDHGWHGINLEPDNRYFGKLKEARPHDINLQVGAGQTTGRSTFYNITGTGLSTTNKEIADEHARNGWEVEERGVELARLADLCRQHRPEGPIHFLKIDVEGAEADVLLGADFTAFRPWIVLVEATLPLSQELSHQGWDSILTSQGYQFVWFDGLNRFYIADEKMEELAQHFRVQPNVFDNFISVPDLYLENEKAVQEARDATHAEYLRRLQAEARVQVAETWRLDHERIAAAMEQGRAALEQANQQLLQRLDQQRAEMSQQAATWQAEMTHQAAAWRHVHDALDASRQACHAAQLEASAAQQQIAAIYRSTSWRLTRPMRKASTALRILLREPRLFLPLLFRNLGGRGELPAPAQQSAPPAEKPVAPVAYTLPSNYSTLSHRDKLVASLKVDLQHQRQAPGRR